MNQMNFQNEMKNWIIFKKKKKTRPIDNVYHLDDVRYTRVNSHSDFCMDAIKEINIIIKYGNFIKIDRFFVMILVFSLLLLSERSLASFATENFIKSSIFWCEEFMG